MSRKSRLRESNLVLIYKHKEELQKYGNYRVIQLTSQTMNAWKKVIEQTLRKEIPVSKNQFEFILEKSTTGPIFNVRQLMKKM